MSIARRIISGSLGSYPETMIPTGRVLFVTRLSCAASAKIPKTRQSIPASAARVKSWLKSGYSYLNQGRVPVLTLTSSGKKKHIHHHLIFDTLRSQIGQEIDANIGSRNIEFGISLEPKFGSSRFENSFWWGPRLRLINFLRKIFDDVLIFFRQTELTRPGVSLVIFFNMLIVIE